MGGIFFAHKHKEGIMKNTVVLFLLCGCCFKVFAPVKKNRKKAAWQDAWDVHRGLFTQQVTNKNGGGRGTYLRTICPVCKAAQHEPCAVSVRRLPDFLILLRAQDEVGTSGELASIAPSESTNFGVQQVLDKERLPVPYPSLFYDIIVKVYYTLECI